MEAHHQSFFDFWDKIPIERLIYFSLFFPTVGGRSGNPCDFDPCGRNTYCEVGGTGAAVCRCLPGFFPKPDTITGCGPQCER